MSETSDKKIVETNLIKQVLSSEVKFILGIIVFVFGVASPYYSMRQDIVLIQKDISTINSNHEVHIQDILQTMKDQQSQIIELQKQIILINNYNKK